MPPSPRPRPPRPGPHPRPRLALILQVQMLPPAPDYRLSTAWAAYPCDHGGAADCFFIHPTAYDGEGDNAAFDEPSSAARTDVLHVGLLAAPFAETCNLYAPRYRQMALRLFGGADTLRSRAASELAYADVRRAFAIFLARREAVGRQSAPWVLAGHSQGALHGTRLLQEVVDTSDAARCCVAAYLIGMAIPLELVQQLKHFAASAGRRRPRCGAVISWNLRDADSGGSAVYLSDAWGPGLWTPRGYRSCVGARLVQTSPVTMRSGPDTEGGDGTFLGSGVPSFEPELEPAHLIPGMPFPEARPRLLGIARQERYVLRPEVTATEVVVHGLNPALVGRDIGNGPGDLHVGPPAGSPAAARAAPNPCHRA